MKMQPFVRSCAIGLALFLASSVVCVSSETIRGPKERSSTASTNTGNGNGNGNNNKIDEHFICLDQEDHPDRMSFFPGYDQPLPSAWYSGYLEYELEGNTVHTHYVLVQAEDSVGPSNGNGDHEIDGGLPLIYWTNGGPGASSLFGLLTEIGPLMLSDESLKTDAYRASGIPTPIYNPYTWTRLGSLLMIDQPAPVGFSYCNDDHKNASSHNCGDISWTDELSSMNSYLALKTFFETKFPCLSTKDLYLTGESYGGIYVPTLARRIYEDTGGDTEWNLKGFAVGDGCLGTETSMCGGLGSSAGFVDYWHLWFMAGHHQMPLNDFRRVMKACSHSQDRGFLTSGSREDDLCKEALVMARKEIGGFFEYALYDECTYRNGLKWKQRLGIRGVHNTDKELVGGALNDYPCGAGPVLEEYLALGDIIREAFHVRSTFFEVDNAEGDFRYTPTEPDLEDFYREVNGKLRVLVYNGDTDPAITSFATQNWTSHLGFDELEHNGKWRPWTVDGCQRMGGYVERYEGGFDFLTIRGAGHMVPTYKPAASFAFLKAWLNNGDYPVFDANCTVPPAELKQQDSQGSGGHISHYTQSLSSSPDGDVAVERE